MFKYILKQLKRSIVTNALFCLLLTLAGTLLCISAGLRYSAHKALLDINETITTIGIPDRSAVNMLANEIAAQRPLQEPEVFMYEINGHLIHEYRTVDPVQEAEEEIFKIIR